MDLEGTSRRTAINLALRTYIQFQGRKGNYDDRRLKTMEGEDWNVLDTVEYNRLFKLEPEGFQDLFATLVRSFHFVWSDDFETHVEHQNYTRQHPREERRVRKVECGLAFELRLDDEMDFIEVE